MPELPEVEVSRMGITPHMQDQIIDKVIVRRKQLRWPVPDEVKLAEKQQVTRIERRAKYLLIHTDPGAIILHLGMSGKLRIVPATQPIQKHDHIDLLLNNGLCLRFNDARRFGACLWQADGVQHSVLSKLGPEPLTEEFSADQLFSRSRGKKMAVKNFIMDNANVVGVGNIYASESLFRAQIDPRRSAQDLLPQEYEKLVVDIKWVLARAIEQGGTTLKDFTQADGSPGYFAQKLNVYGRKGEECFQCQQPVQSVVIGQRNTFFCDHCQK